MSDNSTIVFPFPDSLVYIEYAQNWITMILHFITITTMSFILISIQLGRFLRLKELSPGLSLFFYSHVIFSLLGIPYQAYRIGFWISPKDETIDNNYGNKYSPYLLYWLSMPEFVFYGSIPAVVLILTIERCIALKSSLNWVKKIYKWLSFAIFMIIVGINMLGHLLELPLFDDAPALILICETASCTTNNWRLYFQLTSRIVLSSANVVISIVFLFLLHKTETAKKLKNRVILFTLFVEFVLGVLPTFIAMIFNKYTTLYIGGVPNSGEKGEIVILITAIDSALCGLLYLILLFKCQSSQNINSTREEKNKGN
ncbi:hypothetical protein Mgra_00002524 [Meloidogyne graminicola]|uniref:Uncharacterized protein n=1 Tax=Meloidogyne graminicola TaxID=189291 RepID=A0A8S9ZYT4_9BILA|nr:hypothetical protein Mgra_00002524 [Meloidogyne graminicola]